MIDDDSRDSFPHATDGCSHGAAWSRDLDLMPKMDTGGQTQHLDAHISSPSMNPDCCAHQRKKKDDPEEELSEGGL